MVRSRRSSVTRGSPEWLENSPGIAILDTDECLAKDHEPCRVSSIFGLIPAQCHGVDGEILILCYCSHQYLICFESPSFGRQPGYKRRKQRRKKALEEEVLLDSEGLREDLHNIRIGFLFNKKERNREFTMETPRRSPEPYQASAHSSKNFKIQEFILEVGHGSPQNFQVRSSFCPHLQLVTIAIIKP
ncbi:hypothetical protein VNO77_03108 [Canavalia gladiata]|uniref:Uncharacterized protein n=1 Tax=Canavalia gladiata TaxID=3824 RepID=A0AAN9MUT6_CANGL